MRKMLFGLALAAAAMVLVAAPAQAQKSEGRDPAVIAEQVSKSLARIDLDEVIGMLRIYMGESAADKLKSLLQAFKNFGASQYAEQVYSRDFGKTTKDIIYKHNYDKAIVFTRYLFHLEKGQWILLHFSYKTESELPLPKEWEHIYP